MAKESTCASCGATIDAAGHPANQPGVCPQCGQRLSAPSGDESAQPQTDLSGEATCDDDAYAQPTISPATRELQRVLLVCAALVVAVEVVFGQTFRFDFVNFDDGATVFDNYRIRRGLTWDGVVWAFTKYHLDSSSPLSTVSHMLDCQLFGVRPLGHHLVNVTLHAANAVLLFLLFRRMTGSPWPSAFVAAVFAVHPLHVESVAWVTERKDVLSGLFFLLALAAYLGYLHRRRWLGWYVAMLILFALGLLAKPAVITFPFVLLLLDWWPLGRMVQCSRHTPCAAADGTRSVPATAADGARSVPATGLWRLGAPFARLVLEKTPLFLLVAFSCVWTVLGQGMALDFKVPFSWYWRIGNALMSYVSYVGQSFYPVDLTIMYPRRTPPLPLWAVLGSLLLLVGVTATAFLCRRKCPYLLVGWLWYLGMLVPVIGLVQFGVQSEADRFMYLPQIGLVIALAWGAADVCRRWPGFRWLCGIVAVAALVVFTWVAWRQTSVWRNDDALFGHALACNPRSARSHLFYGISLLRRGQVEAAMAHYQEGLKIDPRCPHTTAAMGVASSLRGQYKEAVAYHQQALAIDPNCQMALGSLALLRATCPDAQFRDGAKALSLAQRAQARYRKYEYGSEVDVLGALAAAYAETGRFAEAVTTANQAMERAVEEDKPAVAKQLQAQIKLYEDKKPYRFEPPAALKSPPEASKSPPASATPATKSSKKE